MLLEPSSWLTPYLSLNAAVLYRWNSQGRDMCRQIEQDRRVVWKNEWEWKEWDREMAGRQTNRRSQSMECLDVISKRVSILYIEWVQVCKDWLVLFHESLVQRERERKRERVEGSMQTDGTVGGLWREVTLLLSLKVILLDGEKEMGREMGRWRMLRDVFT